MAMMIMATTGLWAQNSRRTTVIDDDGQVSVIMVPVTPSPRSNASLENGEAAAIAAGALRIGDCPPAPCAPALAPVPTGQTHTFQGSAHQSSPTPLAPTPTQPAPKRPCWVARAFRNVGLFFRVEGGIGSTGTYQPSEYWVANTPAYDAYYYGSDRVFLYGPSYYSVGSSYRFVDNYRSGPYPPVRFIPDTPRGQPTPHYQPHSSGNQNSGGHRGRH